jgi:competence protein ComEC
MKKLWMWGVGVGMVLISLVVLEWPDENLHLIGCDVGQGDATLVTMGFNQVLIDAGLPNGRVLDCLRDNMPFWDRKIEMMVMSHPQMDHMGGFSEVVDRYEVGALLAGDSVNDIESFWEIFEKVNQDQIRVIEANAGGMIRLGEMEWQVLWPHDELPESFVWDMSVKEDGEYKKVLGVQSVLAVQEKDVNDESVVLKLKFGEATALFTGDIGEKVEGELVKEGRVGQVQLLKVPHHGSKYSNSEIFLKTVNPTFSLIYVSNNNSYGHPSDQVISRLSKLQSTVLRTDIEGELHLVTDGQDWQNRTK